MSNADGLGRVLDDAGDNRFVLQQDGGLSELVYRVNGNRLVLVHTEVPEAIRGRGIAGRLVQAAIERAAAEGMTVVPLCPYVRKWLGAHSEVSATVAIDWGA